MNSERNRPQKVKNGLIPTVFIFLLIGCSNPSDKTPAEEMEDTPSCDNAAQEVSFEVISGPGRSEDLAYDSTGGVLTIAGGDLLRHERDGTRTVVVPGVVQQNIHGNATSHGFAMLPGGDLIIADSGAGSLIRANLTSGSVTQVLGDLPFPNGIAVGPDGVYATLVMGKPGEGLPWPPENDSDVLGAGVLARIDPDTGDYVIVAEDLTLPNGLAFSHDNGVLYIGSHFDGGTIYQFDLETEETTIYIEGVGDDGDGNGNLDGIAADQCGNVYVTDNGTGRIWRVSEDAESTSLVADLGFDAWIPNLHFGSGIGGWSANNLYVVDYENAQMFELPINVPGIKVSPR